MTRDSLSHPNLYVLLPILSGACWGLAGIFVRELAKAGLDNPTIVFTRTGVCALLTAAYLLLRNPKQLKLRKGDFPYILAIAVFGSLLLMVAYNIAVIDLSLSLAAILLCSAPVFVLLISAFLFHEKITLKKVICMVLAIIGCAMLSGVFETSGLQWSFRGLLMGVAAALCNAIFIITSKIVAQRGCSSFTVALYSGLFASILLLPFVDWSALTAFLTAHPVGGSCLLLVQSGCTSLFPTLVYIVAMRHVEAGRTAILQSGAEPSAAFVAGLILYSEVPTLFGLAGMVITIAALMILAGDRS